MSEPPSPTRPAGAGVVVIVADEQRDHPVDPHRWAQLAEHALAHQGIRRGELTLTFVDEDTIAALNAEHMGADGPTDVLAFPLDATDEQPADGEATTEVPVLLGDVVICPAVAATNAAGRDTEPHPGHPTHDGSLDAELALLVVHGVLHVTGHDHAESTETEAMQAAEREILAAAPDKVTP
jgi:probable rRNA maturation factor